MINNKLLIKLYYNIEHQQIFRVKITIFLTFSKFIFILISRNP